MHKCIHTFVEKMNWLPTLITLDWTTRHFMNSVTYKVTLLLAWYWIPEANTSWWFISSLLFQVCWQAIFQNTIIIFPSMFFRAWHLNSIASYSDRLLFRICNMEMNKFRMSRYRATEARMNWSYVYRLINWSVSYTRYALKIRAESPP